MIVAAGLLVLAGLGLFVAGVVSGVTSLYWACVGVCVVAAVLLFLARRQMSSRAPAAALPPARAAGTPAAAAASTSTGRHADRNGAAASGSEPAGSAPVPPSPAEPVVTAPPVEVGGAPVAAPAGEPPVEEVEVTDLLLVVDLKDEVLVVDEHPRYHVTGCRLLLGRETIPIPLDEARTDGFTPCGACRPDATLADRVRARKASGS